MDAKSYIRKVRKYSGKVQKLTRIIRIHIEELRESRSEIRKIKMKIMELMNEDNGEYMYFQLREIKESLDISLDKISKRI